MDRVTGKTIGREEHIRQSIDDILRTPKGTRVMRRDYGVSYLTTDGSVRGNISGAEIAEEADALLTKFEPRIRIQSVSATMGDSTFLGVSVEYTDVEDPDRGLAHAVVF